MTHPHERLLRLATYASVSTALLLVALKAAAWLFSGSVGILASFADSLTDLAASALNLWAVRLALRPADACHPFGHGKAEGLSALAQAALTGASAVFLFLSAAERLVKPEPLQNTGWGMAVMVLSMAATLLLVAFQRYVLQRVPSQAVAADRLHYTADFLSNAAVLAALLAASYGLHGADAWLGLGLAAWIFKNACHIGREAADMLMDKALPPERVGAVAQAALSAAGVLGVHGLKTRRAGTKVFVQLHIEVDAAASLAQAHEAAQAAAANVGALFEDAEVMVHTDPAGTGAEAV